MQIAITFKSHNNDLFVYLNNLHVFTIPSHATLPDQQKIEVIFWFTKGYIDDFYPNVSYDSMRLTTEVERQLALMEELEEDQIQPNTLKVEVMETSIVPPQIAEPQVEPESEAPKIRKKRESKTKKE